MPQSPRSAQSQPSHASTLDVGPDEQDVRAASAELSQAAEASDTDLTEFAEFRKWKQAQSNTSRATAVATHAARPAKEPDPYALDEDVTLLLPSVYRAVIEGRESKSHRVFISAEQPGQIDEDTGRAERGLAMTLIFVGGVCRNIPYGIVKGLKKSRAYRSNDALKVVPNDTSESAYAKLCGVQPMQPAKQAAMLLASDLDAVLAEFDTEQLKVFTEALTRRARTTSQQATQQAQISNGILSSQSFQRG